jgi:hypothetical protein
VLKTVFVGVANPKQAARRYRCTSYRDAMIAKRHILRKLELRLPLNWPAVAGVNVTKGSVSTGPFFVLLH